MDPVSGALGVVAGVTSIVTVIGKSIIALNQLRQKYRDAELNISLLTGQLRIVQRALIQVQGWAESLHGEAQHYQLFIDLEQAISDCHLLVEYIYIQIAKFQCDDQILGAGSKVTYLLEDKATQDCLTRLDHQINALSLCLMATHCRNGAEQKQLLERSQSRKIFDRIKDDTSSLVGFRDAASLVTFRTGSSTYSKLSRIFAFDDVLLRHKIYQDTFRSMLRRTSSPTDERILQKEKKRSLSDGSLPWLRGTSSVSAKIDLALKADARKLNRELKILAIGEKHGRSRIVKQMRQRHGQPFSPAEVEGYRKSITSLSITALVALLDYVEFHGNGLVSQSSRDNAEIVQDYAGSGEPDWKVTLAVAVAVRYIWKNWHVQQAFAIMQQDGQSAYYLNLVERICQPDYVPTNEDILRAPENIETMKETELTIDSLNLRVMEIREQQDSKILSQFADIQFCLFTVDLTCYDRYLDDTGETNELRDRLSSLRSISQSSFFVNSIIVLVFTNAATFRRKIVISPIGSHFEDYAGGSSYDAAMKYILKRFKGANRLELPLFWHIHDLDDQKVDDLKRFFRKFAASIPTVAWLRETGVGSR